MLDSDKLSRRQKLKVEEEIGKLKVEEEIGKRRRRPEQKQHLSRSCKRDRKQSSTVDLRLRFIFRHQSIDVLLNHTTTVRQQRMVCFLVRAPGMSLLKILLSKPSSVAKGVSMRNGLALRLMREKRKWFSNYLGRQSFLTQNSFHLQQMDADSSSTYMTNRLRWLCPCKFLTLLLLKGGEYKGDGRERWSHPIKSPRSEYKF
ncbi:hypothetical protein YC2023_102960 [Brassica napus]